MQSRSDGLRSRRGRPRKFPGPSRSVTLTLPEDVIDALESVDQDLSRAVVRVAQPEMAKRPHAPAELASFGGRSVIVVNPTRTLEKKTGVFLVPLSDGRALIAFDEPLSVARLELLLRDALDAHDLSDDDVQIFEAIGRLLKDARQSESVSLTQRHIIVLEETASRRRRTSDSH
jgi:hypothetical protein